MESGQINQRYAEIFRKLADPASQCDYLLELGIEKPGAEEIRQEKFKIPGCKTAIWLKQWEQEGRARLLGESDSLLVRGVLAVFEEMYRDRSREEIRLCPPEFLDFVSDQVIYPEIRQNGLAECYRRLSGEKEPVCGK